MTTSTETIAPADRIPDGDLPWSEAPLQARLQRLGQIFVDRPVEERIVTAIDSARRDRLIYPEPRNVVITGETGVGKTEIAKRYLAEYPEYRDPDTRCMVRPVLFVDVRNSSTPKAVAIAMLRALGLDEHGRQTLLQDLGVDEEGTMAKFATTGVPDLSHIVKTQMVGQQVEVAILDEFHNTITDNGAVRLNRIADWVKDFAKSKTRSAGRPDGSPAENIVFVLMGTRKVLNVIDPTVNPELASITPYRVQIERYRYGTDDEKTEFREFLDDLDLKLPFDEDSGLGLPYLADKIHVATFGLLRQVGHIVTSAAEIAIGDGFAHIMEHHLHAAVELKRGVLESHLMSAESTGDDRIVVENPFAPPALPAVRQQSRTRAYRPE